MRDYEELVRALRGPVHSLDCEFCNRKCCYPDGVSDDKCVIIQAADAIEELQAYADLYKELTENGQTVARKLLDAYPKWISVEERLPDVKKEVIVCDKMPNGTRYVTTALMLEDCIFWNDCGRMYEVTHWMPLPSTEGLNEA